MEETKLKEFNEKLVGLLKEFNYFLQVQQGIVVVPNKPMEETTPVVEENEVVEETPTEEVA